MFGLQPLSSCLIRHFLLRNAKEVFLAGAEQKRKGRAHFPLLSECDVPLLSRGHVGVPLVPNELGLRPLSSGYEARQRKGLLAF